MLTNDTQRCQHCGSDDLSWDWGNNIFGPAQQGRLKTTDVRAVFYLGCNRCQSTLQVTGPNDIAQYLDQQRKINTSPA